MKSQLNLLRPRVSRRAVLKGLSLASFALKAAPILGFELGEGVERAGELSLADVHLSPHYPSQSPLTDIFRLVPPGSDDYPLEKAAVEIEALLDRWGTTLKNSPQSTAALSDLLEPELDATDIEKGIQRPIRTGFGIDAVASSFSSTSKRPREQFIAGIAEWLKPASSLQTAEFEIFSIEPVSQSSSALRIEVRYDIVSTLPDNKREERVGTWNMEWARDEQQQWRARLWHFGEEKRSFSKGPAFTDVTANAFAGVDSYHAQLMHGADYWRTVIDGAVGIDVYGNNGVAAGDFDGDGFDDLYICQPAGLPNRLYKNHGDGTFEDVTEKAGVGVLDRTACALFADFQNRGRQDLLVVCGSGPLLFLNNGNSTFTLKRDAFKFARPPQGAFTHAAIADYDNDGRLDVYFCLYMYYLGLEQYNYPVPYYDARNGPPNYLFRNQGDGTFIEATEPAGLNVSNNRYSFACAWGDSNGNGHPDLFIANDFGSSQLYRNNGDGTFKDVSQEAHVESVGAGMGCCWADYDNDGRQDVYVPSMWEAAGQRVSQQRQFHPDAPANIRELYQRHARGNALYRNRGDGTFLNVGQSAAVEMGRWSWSSDFWDWDHDGYSDLYVSNGYLTCPQADELAGFFWRQIVAKSPEDTTPLLTYERGWNAINELVRADHTWHGLARNVAFVNNRDGTFTEASGTLQLDFRDDARAFALSDLDHDGRLEVIVKNRTAPQVRVLRNDLNPIGSSISFCLTGTRSNRDAIGASISITAAGTTQTRYLQAGAGFLSQHTKELFIGLGAQQGMIQAMVRWPSGLTQTFSELPVGHRIHIEEGNSTFRAVAHAAPRTGQKANASASAREPLPLQSETWLIQPLRAPAFQLPDIDGANHALDSWSGRPLLLTFWSTEAAQSLRQLSALKAAAPLLERSHLKVVAISLDEPARVPEARKEATQFRSFATVLFATQDVSGIYNILYRHLFDRRRDLPIPASFLIDSKGMIVKIYQGFAEAPRIADDTNAIPTDSQARMRAALPFSGMLIQDAFERNDFTYGVALYQHGFLDQADESFRQVVAAKPDNANAYYNLGTLNLRRNRLAEAKGYLQKTVELRPAFAEAWNNLGMIAAQQGDADEAIRDFQQSIAIRPAYFTAHLNLGNLYRRQRAFDKADASLSRALAIRPDDPEIHYSLGMLFAQQDDFQRAEQYLEHAVALRPDYPEALNNLGVLYVRRQDYARAEDKFLAGIKAAPTFDQSYLNLARLYANRNDKQKARDVLQQLLQLRPDDDNARRALEVLQ
ncbi:FG-GAP-like repeat-containing protein [Occallatibacter riparius]|uniref:FG-GAP-like repeat-containing protein n=1 Tax=Occallatibacter riparius TaxID=1002689 RepID=A0A9J7BVD8_9BACT|nr:FG-GAP-like repeat-containing protein [Occallatibacter riparius]UWZ86592.1 FG-GAP-like repeat-containing protein [Occallatibacter riparius]